MAKASAGGEPGSMLYVALAAVWATVAIFGGYLMVFGASEASRTGGIVVVVIFGALTVIALAMVAIHERRSRRAGAAPGVRKQGLVMEFDPNDPGCVTPVAPSGKHALNLLIRVRLLSTQPDPIQGVTAHLQDLEPRCGLPIPAALQRKDADASPFTVYPSKEPNTYIDIAYIAIGSTEPSERDYFWFPLPNIGPNNRVPDAVGVYHGVISVIGDMPECASRFTLDFTSGRPVFSLEPRDG